MSKLLAILIAHAMILVCAILLAASLLATALEMEVAGENLRLFAKLVLVGVVGATTFVVTVHLTEAFKTLSGAELIAGIVVGLVLAGVGESMAVGISGTAGLSGFVGTLVGLSVGFVTGFSSVYGLSTGARCLADLLSHRP